MTDATAIQTKKSSILLPVLITLGVVAAVALVPIMSYISAYNKGNRLERIIEAQYEQNKNKLSQLSNSVMEAAQVPAMAKKDLKEVIEAAMQGRYGENGSKAYIQAITENYPGQIDPSLYTKLQSLIESGRTDFASEQTQLIAKVQIYKTELGNFWGGMWLKNAGYPTIDFNKYKTINSGYTNDAFETGEDTGIKIGG